MASLEELTCALRSNAYIEASSLRRQLSNAQYNTGFGILVQGSTDYKEFIIPQLIQLLSPISCSGSQVSVLEVGPGPKSVLEDLPHHIRRKIRKYIAYEPNDMFATSLEARLSVTTDTKSPFLGLENPPDIRRTSFPPQNNAEISTKGHKNHSEDHYDIILFCHSMYGMPSKRAAVEEALEMLAMRPGASVIIFHREKTLRLNGLVCHQTATWPSGVVRVADKEETLDDFAPFIAGFTSDNKDFGKELQIEWRKQCRALGSREKAHPDHLVFRSPTIMVSFTKGAAALSELLAQVPLSQASRALKNRQARLHDPASVVQPKDIEQVQLCVRWARKHSLSLAVIGGSHSGHCALNNVVSVDMSSLNQINILKEKENREVFREDYSAIVVVEAGCTTDAIIRRTMEAGVTVPLGSRPSVGAGLWLQGGIGHLSRRYGLACDNIIGAVLISVESSRILCVGHVPSQHQPPGSIVPQKEAEILWAIKGAGTNYGIITSVIFKAYPAPRYVVRSWAIPLNSGHEAQLKLRDFDELVARKLEDDSSADAYLYWDASQLHLGVNMTEFTTTTAIPTTPSPTTMASILGANADIKIVDGIGLFETEMYMSGMHGGHSGGRTSSFKRCIFLKGIGELTVAQRMVEALASRPSPLCYLHLLHGGGAIGRIASDATAFGCRDWHFACVITGVWSRGQDGTDIARAAINWVYSVAIDLLPISSGAYGADLGPDPRDAVLAARAFGSNLSRLSQLKHSLDPQNVLAHACPLVKASLGPKLVFLVTGESCAGKDYCAHEWLPLFEECHLTTRVVSISDAIKRDFARVTGANLQALLSDRTYKEQHRPALTEYFTRRVQQSAQLPVEQFLHAFQGAADADVLFITGMRDQAPVATFSHLVSNSRLLEVHVLSSQKTRNARRGYPLDENEFDRHQTHSKTMPTNPDFVFHNELTGNNASQDFCRSELLPLVHEDWQRLADMVQPITDFPVPDIVFRHVLGIAQQPGGLDLCTALLRKHFAGDWRKVTAIACCEVGGFVFATALATRVNVPLSLIREAGRLPPPTFSTGKCQSHISSSSRNNSSQKRIEIEQSAIPRSGTVLVVDDVLATGETLCAVLHMLCEAGVAAENICIMIVAEFPVHHGRAMLRQRGFGKVRLQSLLVFGGM